MLPAIYPAHPHNKFRYDLSHRAYPAVPERETATPGPSPETFLRSSWKLADEANPTEGGSQDKEKVVSGTNLGVKSLGLISRTVCVGQTRGSSNGSLDRF